MADHVELSTGRARSAPVARGGLLVPALFPAVVSVLLVVLPLAGSSPLAASQLVAVSLVALALAAAVGAAPRLTAILPALLPVGSAVTRDAPPPALRARPTDPKHHPLAPRAPGQA